MTNKTQREFDVVLWGASGFTGALVAEIYGVQRAGTLNGMLTLVHQLGGAAAVFGAGLIFDLSGSYTPFFIVAAATLARRWSGRSPSRPSTSSSTRARAPSAPCSRC